MSIKDSFSTRDLQLAGLLYAKGIKLEKVNREGKVCWFVFGDRKSCEMYHQQFFAKTVEVNAKNYADALRTLKDLVFADE